MVGETTGLPRGRDWPENLLVVIAAIAGVGFLWQSIAKVFLPYQLEFGEGNVLAIALRIAQGETPYPPVGGLPHVFSPYGPVFYYLIALPAKLLGASFALPRALSLAAAIVVAILLFLLARAWAGSQKLAAIFCLLYVSTPILRTWSALLRADFFGIALTLAGLYAFAVHRSRVAPLLFVAALFVKPTLVAGPAACFLYLIVRREYSRAAVFAGVTSVLLALSFTVAQVSTAGAFAFQVLRSHPEAYSFQRYFWLATHVARTQPVVFLLALTWMVSSFLRRHISLAVLYLCTATLATFSAGKLGAGRNHFLEWWAALFLCAAISYKDLVWARATPVRWLVVIGLGLPLFMSFRLYFFPWQNLELEASVRPGKSECRDLESYIRQHGDRVISENVGELLLAHKPAILMDSFIYGRLVEHSGLSQEPLNQMVRARNLDLIVLGYEITGDNPKGRLRWPASFLHAVQQNYSLDRHFVCLDGGVAYIPKAGAPQ